jgi:hypothetical protein
MWPAPTGDCQSGRHQQRRAQFHAPRAMRAWSRVWLARVGGRRCWHRYASLRVRGTMTPLLDGTLIRRIGPAHFDPAHLAWNQRLPTRSNGSPVSFEIHRATCRRRCPRTGSWFRETMLITCACRSSASSSFFCPRTGSSRSRRPASCPRLSTRGALRLAQPPARAGDVRLCCQRCAGFPRPRLGCACHNALARIRSVSTPVAPWGSSTTMA